MALAKLVAGIWPMIWGRGGRSTFVPAVLLGTALIARGEIGVLVATVANASPKHVLGEEAYLEAMWAILVCTAVGPPLVGILLRQYGRAVVDGPWGAVPASEAGDEVPKHEGMPGPVPAMPSAVL